MPHQYSDIRDRIECAIEELIELLDEMDGDPDFEPSLGSAAIIDQRFWASSDLMDLEECDPFEVDAVDSDLPGRINGGQGV